MIARRFFRVSETAGLETFEDLWRHLITNVLDEEAAGRCGSLIRAEANSGDYKGTHIAGTDPVSQILELGVSSLLFLVNHSEQGTERLPTDALAILYGGSTLAPFPERILIANFCSHNS